MNVQSFSIVIPNRECVNRCPFCVSRMVNSNTYPNKMDLNDPHCRPSLIRIRQSALPHMSVIYDQDRMGKSRLEIRSST